MKTPLITYEMDVYCEIPTIRVKAKNKTEAKKKIMAKLKAMPVSKILKKDSDVVESTGYYF